MRKRNPLQAYTKPSMKYYYECLATQQKQVADCIKILGDPDSCDVVIISEFLAGARAGIAKLNKMKADGYFATEAQCGDKDHWIDYKSYYTDKADQCFKAVERLKAMRQWDLDEPSRKNLEAEIDKYTAFAYANRKKAGGPRWYQQARIRAKLMETQNE